MTPDGTDREARVAAIEARYAVTLPEDFRRYLVEACPDNDRWDNDNTAWWGLKEIKSLGEDYAHPVTGELAGHVKDKYLVFADYMVWCWAWVIACADDEHRGKVAIIGASPDRFVADSFDDFLRIYAEDPIQLC